MRENLILVVSLLLLHPQVGFSQIQGLSYSATCLVGSTRLNHRPSDGNTPLVTPVAANLFSYHAVRLTQRLSKRINIHYGLGLRKDGWAERRRPVSSSNPTTYFRPKSTFTMVDVSLLAEYSPVNKWPFSVYMISSLGSQIHGEIFSSTAPEESAAYAAGYFPLFKPAGYFGSRPSMNFDLGVGVGYKPSFAPNLTFRAGYIQGTYKYWFRRVALECSYMLPFRKQN